MADERPSPAHPGTTRRALTYEGAEGVASPGSSIGTASAAGSPEGRPHPAAPAVPRSARSEREGEAAADPLEDQIMENMRAIAGGTTRALPTQGVCSLLDAVPAEFVNSISPAHARAKSMGAIGLMTGEVRLACERCPRTNGLVFGRVQWPQMSSWPRLRTNPAPPVHDSFLRLRLDRPCCGEPRSPRSQKETTTVWCTSATCCACP
jgi:hypothetical protein